MNPTEAEIEQDARGIVHDMLVNAGADPGRVSQKDRAGLMELAEDIAWKCHEIAQDQR